MTTASKIGLIGDVHQEHERLQTVLSYFEEQRVDPILCVGDLADGVGDLGKCIELLKASAVDCVLGNHDRWLLGGTMRDLPDALPVSSLRDQDRSFLSSLPRTRVYDTQRGRLLLCHGMGDDDMGALRPDDEGYALESNFALQELIVPGRYGLVVAGHTHHAMVRRINETVLVNPGTLRGDRGSGSAILDLSAGRVLLLAVQPAGVRVVEGVLLA
jgi:putative phosphoesterase